jgi:hypothetical protein
LDHALPKCQGALGREWSRAAIPANRQRLCLSLLRTGRQTEAPQDRSVGAAAEQLSPSAIRSEDVRARLSAHPHIRRATSRVTIFLSITRSTWQAAIRGRCRHPHHHHHRLNPGFGHADTASDEKRSLEPQRRGTSSGRAGIRLLCLPTASSSHPNQHNGNRPRSPHRSPSVGLVGSSHLRAPSSVAIGSSTSPLGSQHLPAARATPPLSRLLGLDHRRQSLLLLPVCVGLLHHSPTLSCPSACHPPRMAPTFPRQHIM